MRGSQAEQIRAMAAQGYGVVDIASAVGLEIGDVASVAASVTLGMNEEVAGVVTVRLVAFPFRHDTPGLAAGVVAYLPRIGETLLMAWLSVSEPWNGTTPQCNFGPAASFSAPLPGMLGAQDLTKADVIEGGLAQPLGALWPAGGNAGQVPSSFTTTEPLLVVASTDGSPTGADPGATQGQGSLNLLIADPH